MLVDPNYNNVSLLLHCNGSNGSTTFTDNSPSPKNFTAVGNAKISTAQSKFGGASGLLDGTGDYVVCTTDPADYKLHNVVFTMEAWVRPSATSANQQTIIGKASSSAQSYMFYVNGALTTLNFLYSTTGSSGSSVIISGNFTFNIGTWYHVAVVRSGTTMMLFVNGTQVGTTTTIAATWYDTTAPLRIGAIGVTGYEYYFYGNIDEIRITKGVARYTANFIQPTEPFYDSRTLIPVIGSIAITGQTPSVAKGFAATPSIRQIDFTGLQPQCSLYAFVGIPLTGDISITGNTPVLIHGWSAAPLTGDISLTGNTPELIHGWSGAPLAGLTEITGLQPKHSSFTFLGHPIVGQVDFYGLQPDIIRVSGNAALVIPSLFAYATGYSELPNSATLVLPGLIGTAAGGAIASGILPSLLITATGTQELHGTAAANLPGLYATATGQREYNGNAALVIPGFNASSFGAATAECFLPGFTAAGTGIAEFGGKAQIILPGLTIAATGQREYNGTAALVLPGLRAGDRARAALVVPGLSLSASGGVAFANSVGYVMNVHTEESWQWSNMAFMHIIRIGTDYYGVKSTGLYRLSTDYTTDSGTAINAKIKTKETDRGSYKSKRLQYTYLGSDTATVITPIVDGVAKASHASAFGGRKTKMSLKNAGRYWSLEISGIQELTGLELLPQELQRRVK